MRDDLSNIVFDAALVEKLRDAHRVADLEGKSMFKFEGKDMLTGYSKYLLQYLDMHFNKNKDTQDELPGLSASE